MVKTIPNDFFESVTGDLAQELSTLAANRLSSESEPDDEYEVDGVLFERRRQLPTCWRYNSADGRQLDILND